MVDFTGSGLGLDVDEVWCTPAREEWRPYGDALRAETAAVLGDLVLDVQFVGSASVAGLFAKPIIDLAVGTPGDPELDVVRVPLEAAGWIYRGDAGGEGGLVFVLESRPGRRVSHLHVVVHNGEQWRNYLRFRELLRRDPEARATYGAAKLDLAERFYDNRQAYTAGKRDTVETLLGDAGAR